MGGCVVRSGWCVICKSEWDSNCAERWGDRICRRCMDYFLNHPLLVDEDAVRAHLDESGQKLAALRREHDALVRKADEHMAGRTPMLRFRAVLSGEDFPGEQEVRLAIRVLADNIEACEKECIGYQRVLEEDLPAAQIRHRAKHKLKFKDRPSGIIKYLHVPMRPESGGGGTVPI